MGIKSIRIKNLLSFKAFHINDFSDFNCIIGKNNVGKSNLLKIIDFFYKCLDNIKDLPPALHSNYSAYGEITVVFNTSRLEDVVRRVKGKSDYQKHIYKTLFKSELNQWEYLINKTRKKESFMLSLRINKDNSIRWSDNDKNVRDILSRIYPFLYIDTRRLDLYNWKSVWDMVSKLKFLNTKGLSREGLVDFIDDKVSGKSNSYKDYVNVIRNVTKAAPYDYRDLILNYIKVGLEGHTFNINGNDLATQSDGTNSYQFLEVFLHLVIILTRREFITPVIFVDEPEIGLHPKKAEGLIESLHDVYRRHKSTNSGRETGKYNTPYPVIFFATHSPNILKMVIKLYENKKEHSIFHFSIEDGKETICTLMNSNFKDKRFLNIFSDNEARLFFSNFILFVEGETELELFGNSKLRTLFPVLKGIDVFRTNEVMLRAVNPAKSNVSIPYMVLYDADKMISINPKTGSIDFMQKEVNLHEIRSNYRSSYWGGRHYDYHRRLSNILSINGVANDLDKYKISFAKFNLMDMISRVNRVLIKSERFFVASTTIEGLLINKNSLRVFIRWIISQFNINAKIGVKGDPNIVIPKFHDQKVVMGTYRCFKSIYGGHSNDHVITAENKLLAEDIKKCYLVEIMNEFRKLKIKRSEILIICRVAFNGKTDTLYSKENDNYKYVNQTVQDLVTIIDSYLFPYIPGANLKTGGWVTSFINFAFDFFQGKSENILELKYEINRAFPELNVIIKEISSSID